MMSPLTAVLPRNVPVVGKRALVTVSASSVVLWHLLRYLRRVEVRALWASRLLRWFSTRLNQGFRYVYQNAFVWETKKSPEGHSHGESAALRTSADLSIDRFAHSQGLSVYTVSSSSRSKTGRGYHAWYSSKDVVHAPRYDDVCIQDVIKMVDVDYYTDMAHWVSLGVPVLLYTFSPKKVAGKTSDGVYTIKDDVVHYRVNGGAGYEHELWDYDTDWLQVRGWWNTVVCSVEHKRVADDREVILITPEYRINTLLAWFVHGKPLQRRKFNQNGVNMSAYLHEGEAWVSVGLPGEYSSVSYPQKVLKACQIRYAEAKTPHISDLERLACHAGDPDASVHAALLYHILPKITNFPGISRTEGGVYRPQQYQSVKGLVTEDGKPSGVCFAPPLAINPDVVPVQSRNNDEASVEGRVKKTQNSTEPPRKYFLWAREFVEFLVPHPTQGCPISHAEVDEIQCRPTQRVRTERERPWMQLRAALKVTAFQKAESYGAYNDPRMISQCNTSHTLNLSAYTYPFKADVLKRQEWYGPGKTPPEIARRLLAIAKGSVGVSETDFSRFDGTISPWLRLYIEQAMYLRWVNPRDRDALRELLQAEVQARCVTRNGVRYRTNGQRLSGSPLTTDGNTAINAFVSYCAGRLEGSDPARAWKSLGIYAGDDGVTSIGGIFAEQAAVDLGLKLKCQFREAGSEVAFLGRIFPNLWVNDGGSLQDPHRTIRKLHISFGGGHDMEQLARNKCSGLLLLDPHAPLVAAWCRLVLRSCAGGALSMDEIAATDVNVPYMVRFCKEAGCNGWPQLGVIDAFKTCARSLGVDVTQVTLWETMINRAALPHDVECLVPTKVEEKLQVATSDPLREVVTGVASATTSDSGAPTSLPSGSTRSRRERRSDRARIYSRS